MPKGKRRKVIKQKRYREARARYELKITIKDSLFKNRLHQEKEHRKRRQPKSQKDLIAPKNMSLIENPEELLYFFDDANKYLGNRHSIFFDISELKNLTIDAISLLLLKTTHPKFHRRMPIRGNVPKNPALSNLLEDSGFFKHMHRNIPIPLKPVLLSYIAIDSDESVRTKIAKDIRKFASNSVFGTSKRLSAIYETCIECMSNTVQHATEEDVHVKEHWLINANYDAETNVVRFCFIDVGIGILKSLDYREPGFFGKWVAKYPTGADLIQGIVSRQVPSRTKESGRGRGLPSIYECYTQGKIARLVIISNSIYADFDNKIFKNLSRDFAGTMIYWEFNPSCKI